MKTALAMIAVSLGLITAALPASAAYVSPDASFGTKAFSNGY